MTIADPRAAIDLAALQQRTLRVLMAAAVLGSVAVSLGFTVGAVAAVDLSGSDAVGGAVLTASALGAALAAALLARLAGGQGRGPSLGAGYSLAASGGAVAAAGVGLGWWPVLMLGMLFFGAGMATSLAARFAAADLAEPDTRGRAVGTVLWAGTAGAVAGPNLAGPAGEMAATAGLAEDAGVFLLAAVLSLTAALIVLGGLRPDPLQTARVLAGGSTPDAVTAPRRSKRDLARAYPLARAALAGIALLHFGMVAVMSMTPVHLHHGGAELDVIGLVISAHIAGMYLLSPVFGVLSDRLGRPETLLIGLVIATSGALIAAGAGSHDTGQVTLGLTLVGLGWSAGMVAGSAQLVAAVEPADRARVQGISDVAMNLAGAVGGLLAGILVAVGSFGLLGVLIAAVLAAGVPAALRLRKI